MEASAAYPVTLEVDYPERQSRWKTLFRLFLSIPVLLFVGILASGAFAFQQWVPGRDVRSFSIGAGGSVILAIWIAIVVRGSIPRWLFNFQVALMRFQTRAYGYFALLTDVYPPFEGEYPIRLEVQYPEKVSRWKVFFWKVVTAIPHFVVLSLLWMAAILCVAIDWLVILFSGRCPREIHQFIVGVMRWSLRVQAYVFSLTDEYPPFSLADDAGPAGRDTYVVASVIGSLLAAAFVVGLAALGVLIARGLPAEKVRVSYESLLQGRLDPKSTSVDLWDIEVALEGVVEPANELVPVFLPDPGKHLVAFELTIENNHESRVRVAESDLRLKDSGGNSHKPVVTAVDGRIPPIDITIGDSAMVIAIFEIADDLNPTQLRYARPLFQSFGRPVVYEFE